MKPFVSIILAGLLLFSCTKYEKGPKISFRKERKLLKAEWQIETIYKNGNDYTFEYYNQPGADTMAIKSFFLNYIKKKQGFNLLSYSYFAIFIMDSAYAQKSFSYKKGFFTMAPDSFYYFSPSSTQGSFYTNKISDLIIAKPGVQYKILRLTKKELWIKTTNLIDQYEIHLTCKNRITYENC